MEDEFYFFSMNCFHLIQLSIYLKKFLKFYLFIYLFLAMLGVCRYEGFPLVVASGHYPVVAGRGLLIAVASLVVECGLHGMWASVAGACGLSGCCSGALEHQLNSCGTKA